ncbi:MAG: Uma2 family endonuclease, partial [Polyangiales bacterium]
MPIAPMRGADAEENAHLIMPPTPTCANLNNMTAASARATYQDVLDAPTEVIAQVIDGTLYTTPRPGVLHAGVSSALGVHLGAPYQFGAGDGPGGWIFLDEAELHLGDDIVVPDLAGWRRERLPQLPAAPFLTLAPDWLCEVLSPSTQAID